MRRTHADLSGFTLIELLVVLAIVAILVSLLLPAVQQVREMARRSCCKSNLRQLSIALQDYHAAGRIFPSGQYFCKPGTPCKTRPHHHHGWGWSASLLPFVDQGPLFQAFDFTRPLRDSSNLKLLENPLELFQCPSDSTRKDLVPPSGFAWRPERLATSSYVGNGGSFGLSFEAPVVAKNEDWTNGVLGRDSARRVRDITDGCSNTAIVGETVHYDFYWDPTLYGNWDPPSGAACCTLTLVRQGNRRLNPGPTATVDEKREGFSSLHAGGAHFAFCDGSVHFISELIDTSSRQFTWTTSSDPFDRVNGGADYKVYQRLFSRNDSLTVGAY